MGAIHPVDLVTIGHIQAHRLLRQVAGRLAHLPTERLEDGPILAVRHAGRAVAPGPEDHPAEGVEGEVRADLLPPVDDAAVDERGQRRGFRRRPGSAAAVVPRPGIATRAAAATPGPVVVAVEIGPDGARPRCRLAVLAPVAIDTRGVVELGPVRVEVEHDPQLSRVDAARGVDIGPVSIHQRMQETDGGLDPHVLAGVMTGDDEHLRLGLIGRDVVADLGRPQLATLPAATDAEALDDARMGRCDRGHLRLELGVGVIAGVG